MILQMKYVRAIALLLALSISSVTPALAQVKMRDLSQDPQTGRIIPTAGNVGISAQEQVQVGKKAAQEVGQQMPLLPENSNVTRYVQNMGQRLAAKVPGQRWPFEFHVVNQKEINAFALPGGPIFVNLGTIQMADESELAGVMAHEISHVVLQHSARDAGKQQKAQIGGALGAMIAGAILGNGMAGQLAGAAAQLGAGAWAMKYSRADETEADLLGAQIMYDAGYDPYSMVEFFDVLAKQGGGGGPQFLSDHPNPGNRSQTVSQAIQKFPKRTFPRNDSNNYVAMRREADGMKPYTAEQIAQMQQRRGTGGQAQPQQPMPVGSVNAGDITPSRTMRDLNQQGFRMKYPSNWEVMNQGSDLVIAPRAGVSQSAIAYGVSINAVQGGDIDQLTQSVLQNLSQSNPDMRAAGNVQRVRVNGRDARSIQLTATSPLQDQSGRQVRERDWLVAVPTSRGDAALIVVFTAPEQDFNKLSGTYQNMLRSLQVQ